MTPELASAAMQFLSRLGRRNPAQDQVLPEEYSTYLAVIQALRQETMPAQAAAPPPASDMAHRGAVPETALTLEPGS